MRTIKHLAIIGVVALMSACASTANFPVSSTVPAADITATKKHDKNKNFVIEVTAINLAEASRLNPPKNNYSVWIVVENGITKIAGRCSIASLTEFKCSIQAVVSAPSAGASERAMMVCPSGAMIGWIMLRLLPIILQDIQKLHTPYQ